MVGVGAPVGVVGVLTWTLWVRSRTRTWTWTWTNRTDSTGACVQRCDFVVGPDGRLGGLAGDPTEERGQHGVPGRGEEEV